MSKTIVFGNVSKFSLINNGNVVINVGESFGNNQTTWYSVVLSKLSTQLLENGDFKTINTRIVGEEIHQTTMVISNAEIIENNKVIFGKGDLIKVEGMQAQTLSYAMADGSWLSEREYKAQDRMGVASINLWLNAKSAELVWKKGTPKQNPTHVNDDIPSFQSN